MLICLYAYMLICSNDTQYFISIISQMTHYTLLVYSLKLLIIYNEKLINNYNYLYKW